MATPFLASHALFLHGSYHLLIYHVIGTLISFALCFFPQEQGVLSLEAIDILDHVIVCCWELSWASWDVSAASLALTHLGARSNLFYSNPMLIHIKFPDIIKCPLGGGSKSFPVENH